MHADDGETMTTTDVAELLGISPGAVRWLVHMGRIEPLQRGAHPLVFRTDDVLRYDKHRRERGRRDNA